jgi:hypothetical protein
MRQCAYSSAMSAITVVTDLLNTDYIDRRVIVQSYQFLTL